MKTETDEKAPAGKPASPKKVGSPKGRSSRPAQVTQLNLTHMVEPSASKESVLSASNQHNTKTQSYNSGQHKIHTSRNSLVPSDLKSIKLKSFSRANRKSMYDDRHLADTTFMQKKTFIAPGNLGTCVTVTQWNPASNVILGTNKV